MDINGLRMISYKGRSPYRRGKIHENGKMLNRLYRFHDELAQ